MNKSSTPAYDLPWSLEEFERDGDTYGHIVCNDGTIVCEIRGILDACGNRQNAEFILNAVNSTSPALVPADVSALVERLETDEAYLRGRVAATLHTIANDIASAASLIQSQAARITELERERETWFREAAERDALKVKPLEWIDAEFSSFSQTKILGHYIVRWRASDERWTIDGLYGDFGSRAEAKAAAQADYERRILSTLSPSIHAMPNSQDGHTESRDREGGE